MQLYRGLDVITNKATVAEQEGVPHHLMSFLDPAKGERYDLPRWLKEAKRIGETRCLEQGKVPVVVGGTIYWVQNLVCPGRVVEVRRDHLSEEEEDGEATGTRPRRQPRLPQDEEVRLAFEGLDEEQQATWRSVTSGPLNSSSGIAGESAPIATPRQMHRLLSSLDPLMAQRWHPLDGRKIANSLHVIARTGRRHSDWIKEQDAKREEADGEDDAPHWAGKPTRTLIFWVYADREVLKTRLDARVDKMIPRGLLDEIRELRAIAAAAAAQEVSFPIDTTQGIFQAIGYKEFKPFLDALDERERNGEEQLAPLVTDDGGIAIDSLPADLRPPFVRGLEAMKTATRHYARKQVGWMRNKLLPEIAARRARGRGDGVQIVLLDATKPEEWEEKVKGPALRAVDAWLEGKELPQECWEGEATKTALLPFLNGEAPPEGKNANIGSARAASAPGSSSLHSNAQVLCQVCTAASHAAAAYRAQGKTQRSGRDAGDVYYRAINKAKHMNSKAHRGAVARERRLEKLRSGHGFAGGREATRKKEEREAFRREARSSGEDEEGQLGLLGEE